MIDFRSLDLLCLLAFLYECFLIARITDVSPYDLRVQKAVLYMYLYDVATRKPHLDRPGFGWEVGVGYLVSGEAY